MMEQFEKEKIFNRGITLIALIITIIVLLILAGISIVTLSGENGIVNYANKAKNKIVEKSIIESVQVEVISSYGEDGEINIDRLNKKLESLKGIQGGLPINTLPATITLDGYDILIDVDGSVIKTVTLAHAKGNGTVFDENTRVLDIYGNTINVPAGFKIPDCSADSVTGGIVIEDTTYENTKGSQFVWIPVGDVYTDVDRNEATKENIQLGRYTFDSVTGEKKEYEANDYIEEDSKDTENLTNYSNKIAKDIVSFKASAEKNKGYYIGRFEARVKEYDSFVDKNSGLLANWTGYIKNDGTNPKIVCDAEEKVWNYVTQNKAAELSKNMYNEIEPFTSDLINSYAWDTAIVFLQTFDDRTDKNNMYANQSSLNNTVALYGTNKLDTAKQDKICNIWDMASNCFEWTTETYSNSINKPCTHRGDSYANSVFYTSSRCNVDKDDAWIDYSFRPILYL